MKKIFKVSAVQIKVLSEKTDLPKILRYIKLAAKSKSEIICFPECSFNPNYKKPATEKDLSPILQAAKTENIFIIINGYFKGKNDKTYNRTYIISNKGKILGFYDKIYLWTPEVGKVSRGKKIKVINTSLGKIGLCTCWDLFFPSIFQKLKNKGAEIIFCPSYWTDEFKKEDKFLRYIPTTVAYQYMTFFVYCNALFKGKTSVSQITAPWGELAMISFKEGMATAKIYSQQMETFKKHFKEVSFGRRM
jgi:predicted amidohydrolase